MFRFSKRANAKRKMIIRLVSEAMQGYVNFEEDFEECLQRDKNSYRDD